MRVVQSCARVRGPAYGHYSRQRAAEEAWPAALIHDNERHRLLRVSGSAATRRAASMARTCDASDGGLDEGA
jgi:hypothetical protein